MPIPAHALLMASGKAAPAWVPTDITGCIYWYDAADAASITESGGAVSAWNDKSGNTRHLSQSTAGAKPTTGSRTQNSLNVIDFDGSADFMKSGTFTQAQPLTIFIVELSDTVTGTLYSLGDDGTTPTLYTYLGAWSYYAGGGVSTATSTTTTAHVHAAKFNGTSGSQYWLDGASINTSASVGTSGYSTKAVVLGSNSGGTGNFWNGWIAELIGYDSVLGTTDRQTVEAYLKNKWGTP